MRIPLYDGTDPLPLHDAIEKLDAAHIPDSSKAALRSTLIDAVRHLALPQIGSMAKSAFMDVDIQPYLPILHVAARAAAESRGHQRPGEHASRAARVVEILTGMRPTSARFRYECPPAFRPLVAAKADRHANGALGYLARLCVLANVPDAPARLPTREELHEAAAALATTERGMDPQGKERQERHRKRVRDALSIYRTAREIILSSCTSDEERAKVEAAYAPSTSALNEWRACHIATEPSVIQAVVESGHKTHKMTPLEILEVVNPDLTADIEAWERETRGTMHSPSYQASCRAAVLRVAAWVVRAKGLGRLREVKGIDDLWVLTEDLSGAVVVNSRAARRVGIAAGSTVSASVSLLEACAEDEAARALARSTVTNPEVAGKAERGRSWFTDSLRADCERIWSMTLDLYKEIHVLGPEGASRWALVLARHAHLMETIDGRRVPGEARVTAKDKLRMIRTVTLPPLVCVGIPMRRREAFRLRAAWAASRLEAVRAGHADPDVHPAVREALDSYLNVAVPLTMLCVAVDDGLRPQQYTEGRLGSVGNFRLGLHFDSSGRPTGIAKATTWWGGDKTDPAHLKIRKKDGRPAVREDRDLRPGVVNLEILWDVVTLWRPRQLARAGAIADVAGYDLVADMKASEYALFPTDSAEVTRPNRSRTDVSAIIGRELHTIVRAYLRPELSPWDELDSRWRALWAAHILRLLNASYWAGVRDEMEFAKLLTMDTERTLRRHYIAVNPYIQDRLGLQTEHWEHPRAYDRFMDDLCLKRLTNDPLSDPALPLPPGLDTGAGVAGKTAAKSSARIRRARPRQTPPTRPSAPPPSASGPAPQTP